jgi:hypothetical protein
MSELLELVTADNLALLAWIVGAFVIGLLIITGVVWIAKFFGALL